MTRGGGSRIGDQDQDLPSLIRLLGRPLRMETRPGSILVCLPTDPPDPDPLIPVAVFLLLYGAAWPVSTPGISAAPGRRGRNAVATEFVKVEACGYTKRDEQGKPAPGLERTLLGSPAF